MKKFLLLIAIAGFGLSAMAQDADPVQKYSVATNSFWSNWYIQAGVDWNAWYSDEEHGQGLSHSPFKKFRSNPGAAIAIGKWFTPGLGLRTKLQGIWGKAVTDGDNYGNGRKYWSLNEDVMFNLSNLFCGYSDTRVWNVIPFIGAGVNRDMSDNQYAMQLSVGLQSSWRLNKHLSIYLEGGLNRLEQESDGTIAAKNVLRHGTDWEGKDQHLYAELGLTFNLGKATFCKVPDVDAIKSLSQSQIDALNAQLGDANAENARLKQQLANQPKVTNTKEYVTTPVSVFFNLGKSKIASRKDLVNVKELAEYAKNNNAKLKVTGYADNGTGSSEFNQKLSEKRAQAVADELVKLGVSRDNITTEGKGGVNSLTPDSYNRRAVVEVAK